MWRGRDRSRSGGPQYGRLDRASVPYDRHPPPDQYYDRVPLDHQYDGNRRDGPQFHQDDGFGDRYERSPYTMQPQGGFPQRQAYSGRGMETQRGMQGPGRIDRGQPRAMDRGGRAFPAQQRAPLKSAGFSGPAQRTAPAAYEKPRLPQEVYFKRQSMRWLIKQRLQQVRKAIENLKAAKAERSAEGKRQAPTPVAGLMMGDVKTDFELTFGQTLNYSELGHKKLREVLEHECNDFLKPPTDQYVVELGTGTSKVGAGEAKAAAKHKLPSGKLGKPDLAIGLNAVLSKSLRFCGYSAEDIEEQLAAAGGSGAGTSTKGKGDAAAARLKGGARCAAAGKGEKAAGEDGNALMKSDANVMGVQSDDDMDDIIVVEDEEPAADADNAAAEATGGAAQDATGAAAKAVATGKAATKAAADGEGGDGAAAAEGAPEVAQEATAEDAGAGGDAARVGGPADPNKVHETIPSDFWVGASSLDMSPALRDFIGTVRTKMSHVTCDTLLPSPFNPALPCPPSAAPVGWHADAEGSEDDKVVRRVRVNEVASSPMEEGCVRAALDVASLLPKGGQQNSARRPKNRSMFMNACDVSDLLEYAYADLLILSEQSPDAACDESLQEIGDAIRASPEWLLGLAALPLALHKIQNGSDPACVRYVVVSQDDRNGPDVCAALRRLRQAVVVGMLDAVPSVRSIIQQDAQDSPVLSLGEAPDDLPCLRASTVVERIDNLIGKALTAQLLAAVRCDTLEAFIDSVHCCDLVCRMPHPDEPAAVLCSRFSPLGDLRNSLDMRLRRMAGLLSDAAAAAEKGGASAEASAAADKAEGAENAEEGQREPGAAVRGRGNTRKGKNRGKRSARGPPKRNPSDPHTLRLLSLLRDHQLMWGYGFLPVFCGTSSVFETLNVFLSDMVVNAGPGDVPRWVHVSPETLMRYMIQDQLQQAEIAMVDAEEKRLLAEAGGAAGAEGGATGAEGGCTDAAAAADAQPSADAPMREDTAETDGGVEGDGDGEGEGGATDEDIEVVGHEEGCGGAADKAVAHVKEEGGVVESGGVDGTAEPGVAERGAEAAAAEPAGAATGEEEMAAADADAHAEDGAAADEADAAVAEDPVATPADDEGNCIADDGGGEAEKAAEGAAEGKAGDEEMGDGAESVPGEGGQAELQAEVESAGEDDVLQVRHTVAKLKADYRARYGVEHPAQTDEDLVASLHCLRWLFDVTWDKETGYVTICEIPQKLDYVAEVADSHRTCLGEFLKKAFVEHEPAVLLYYSPDTANNGSNDKSKEAAAKASAEKAKEQGKSAAGGKTAAAAAQAEDEDDHPIVVVKKEVIVEPSAGAATGKSAGKPAAAKKGGGEDGGKQAGPSKAAAENAGAAAEGAGGKRKAAAAKDKAPEKRQKAGAAAAPAAAAATAGTQGKGAAAGSVSGRRGGGAGGNKGGAAAGAAGSGQGRRGPFADPGGGARGQRGAQGGGSAAAASGGVRGPFSNNSAGANRRSGGAAGQPGPAQMGGRGNRGGAGVGAGGNVRRGAVAEPRGRAVDTARGAIRGRDTIQSAPRVSSIGERMDGARRGASLGRGGPLSRGSLNSPHSLHSSRHDRSRSRPGLRGGSMTRYGGGDDLRGVHLMGGYDRHGMHVEEDLGYRGRSAVRAGPHDAGRSQMPGAYGSPYRSQGHSRDVGRVREEDAYGRRAHADVLDHRSVTAPSRQLAGARGDYDAPVSNQQAYTVVPASTQQAALGAQYTEARLPDGQIIQVMIPATAQEPMEADTRMYATSGRYQVAQEQSYAGQVVPAKQTGRGLYAPSVQEPSVAVGSYMHDSGRRDYDEPGHALDAEGRAAMMAYAGAGGVVYEAEAGAQRTVSAQQFAVQHHALQAGR